MPLDVTLITRLPSIRITQYNSMLVKIISKLRFYRRTTRDDMKLVR